MKKHAIIPIFIPHEGCPNDCVFCNQKAITARDQAPSLAQVQSKIEEHLKTLSGRGLDTIEIAFFGGSFTGLPMEKQTEYLEAVQPYKKQGLVHKLHLSTRPDYIDREILDNLKKYGVDVIELGVQSFDEGVLQKSNRGHSVQAVYDSSRLIREYGFALGIQLMIGLPGDSYESCLHSARETVSLKPDLARLYPTVILQDTELYRMYQRGTYQPRSEEETLRITKDMYRLLRQAGIYILRVGLKSTEVIRSDGDAVLGAYHPAFRQLVEGELAREDLEEQLQRLMLQSKSGTYSVQCSARGENYSNLIGNGRRNAVYFETVYPHMKFRFCRDDTLKEDCYRCELVPERMTGSNHSEKR